jgi:hypothetical protein
MIACSGSLGNRAPMSSKELHRLRFTGATADHTRLTPATPKEMSADDWTLYPRKAFIKPIA